jgi:hypothetical protein
MKPSVMAIEPEMVKVEAVKEPSVISTSPETPNVAAETVPL